MKKIQKPFHGALAMLALVSLVFLLHALLNSLALIIFEVIPTIFMGKELDIYAKDEGAAIHPFVMDFASVGLLFTFSMAVLLLNFTVYLLTGGKPGAVVSAVSHAPKLLLDAVKRKDSDE